VGVYSPSDCLCVWPPTRASGANLTVQLTRPPRRPFVGVFSSRSLCVYVIRTFELPNAKVATILLCMLFCYDIFWVYVSPYIVAYFASCPNADNQATDPNNSVMVHVAKGMPAKDGERGIHRVNGAVVVGFGTHVWLSCDRTSAPPPPRGPALPGKPAERIPIVIRCGRPLRPFWRPF
jgi:hypothetical protein